MSVVEDSSIETIDDIGAVADACEHLEQRKMIEKLCFVLQ